MNRTILLAFLLSIFATFSNASIGGYISENDEIKFFQVAVASLKLKENDIASPYYGAKTFSLFGKPLVKVLKMDNCAHIKALYKANTPLDVSYNALTAWKLLECEGKVHKEDSLKNFRAALDDDKSTIADIHYSLELLTLLNQPIPNPSKVATTIAAKLKQDDSLLSLGHALHAAALLGNSGKFMNDRVEDIVVQADEVDGKLLQWEGGLTTTSLLITGLLRLPGVNALTQAQADKLGNYLLTRKTVPTPKGVVALLEAATALAASSVSPVSISVAGSSQVTVENPKLQIQISNIFGKPLKSIPSPLFAQSVTRITDDVVVLHKETISATSKPTEFALVLKPLEPGYYKVAVTAGNNAATLYVRFLGPVEIKSFEIGLSEPDGSNIPKLPKLTYPGKLSSTLQGDASQQLVAKFSLTRPVHQAFLRLHSGKKEIIFVAEIDNNKVYKVVVNLAQELTSGKYDIELILGDSIVTNPIRWSIGSLEAKLGAASAPTKAIRAPKPEIKHLFREPEKRPSPAVSFFFSGLTAAPFLLLLILWGKIGVRLSIPAIAVPYHLGFGSILGLFTLFWLRLDMFTTCAWLIPIGGFTFLAGHRLLRHMASNTSKKAEK